MAKNKVYALIIQGLVQGVGFRPFIYRIAKDLGMKGCVENMNNGVRILVAIGYGFHAVIPEDELVSKVQMYSHEILYILIAICVFIVGFLIYKGMKKSK